MKILFCSNHPIRRLIDLKVILFIAIPLAYIDEELPKKVLGPLGG